MGSATSAPKAQKEPTRSSRIKPSTLRNGFLHNKYEEVWSLSPDRPDRHHKKRRFDKFRELDEATKPVFAYDLAEHTMVLASAMADSTVHLWDLLIGGGAPELKVTLRAHKAHVWAVVFSPNETALATGSGDKTVRIWVAETGMPLQVLEAHTQGVRCLAFSMDGFLLSGGMDSMICLWEYESNTPTAQWKAHEGHVHSIGFQPREHKATANRGLALSVGADGYVAGWQISAGNYKPIGKFPGGSGQGVLCVAQHTSEDGWCACGNEDGAVWIWNFEMEESEVAGNMTPVSSLRLVGHKQSVRTVAFSPNGCLLASGSTDGFVRVWDIRTMCDPVLANRLVCAVAVFAAHDSWVTGLRFEGGQGTLVTSSADGLVKSWRAPDRINRLKAKNSWREEPEDKQAQKQGQEEPEDPEPRGNSLTQWARHAQQLKDPPLQQLRQLFSASDGEDTDSTEDDEEETSSSDGDASEAKKKAAPPPSVGKEPDKTEAEGEDVKAEEATAEADARAMEDRRPKPKAIDTKEPETASSTLPGARGTPNGVAGSPASATSKPSRSKAASEAAPEGAKPGAGAPPPPPPPPDGAPGGPAAPRAGVQGRIDPRARGKIMETAAQRTVVAPQRRILPA